MVGHLSSKRVMIDPRSSADVYGPTPNFSSRSFCWKMAFWRPSRNQIIPTHTCVQKSPCNSNPSAIDEPELLLPYQIGPAKQVLI